MDFWYVLVYLSNNPSTPNTGKILIIGGSIANFTNVAATFKVTSHRGPCSFWGKWVWGKPGREVSVSKV